ACGTAGFTRSGGEGEARATIRIYGARRGVSDAGRRGDLGKSPAHERAFRPAAQNTWARPSRQRGTGSRRTARARLFSFKETTRRRGAGTCARLVASFASRRATCRHSRAGGGRRG